MENLEYRMYVLVLRQLNGINKGIQAAHACIEYALQYNNTEEFKKYAEFDKTLIMLDGGTSNDLNTIDNLLYKNGIKYAKFIEPDINNTITAICFLADERVYNKEKYPYCNNQFLKEAFFVSAATQSDKDIDPTVIIGDPYLKFVFQTNDIDKVIFLRSILEKKKLSI